MGGADPTLARAIARDLGAGSLPRHNNNGRSPTSSSPDSFHHSILWGMAMDFLAPDQFWDNCNDDGYHLCARNPLQTVPPTTIKKEALWEHSPTLFNTKICNWRHHDINYLLWLYGITWNRLCSYGDRI